MLLCNCIIEYWYFSALPLWGFLIVWKIYERVVKKDGHENVAETSTQEEAVNIKSKIFIEPE